MRISGRRCSEIATERQNLLHLLRSWHNTVRQFFYHVMKAQLDARVLTERAENWRLWCVGIKD
jgi:hypothetical protein